MEVVCIHCGDILAEKESKLKRQEVSHGDCLTYKPVPCKQGKVYYENLATQFKVTYDEMLKIATG